MKRLISGVEAAQASMAPEFPYFERVTPAIERMPFMDAYRLWRSLPGYRKACRMLRRRGRRIHTAAGRRFLVKLAKARAIAFPPLYVSPNNSLLRAMTAPKEP